jgi:hypothetical protein
MTTTVESLQTQQQHYIVRPTEAQLRWAQFHHQRVATYVKERVRRMYMYPTNINDIPNTIPTDLEGLEDMGSMDDNDNNAAPFTRSERPKISKGRQVLLRVSQRLYEERRQRIAKEGFCYSSSPSNDNNEEKDDILDSIFAESKVRTQRKRRRSMRLGISNEDDNERIRRFESAFYALLSSLAALEEKNQHTEKIVATKKWTRPEGVHVNVTVDGRDYSDLKWGVVGKSSTTQTKFGIDNVQPIDRGASWMVHIPSKTTKFSDAMRIHLQDVARRYLKENKENENVSDEDKVGDYNDDDDDVVSFVECFERHITDTSKYINTAKVDDGPTPVTPRDIASFVAKFEQHQRGNTEWNDDDDHNSKTKNVVQIISPTTADLISRFENQQEKDGFVQRLVSVIEKAITEHQPSELVSADGKLHKPTFARLIQRYLISLSSTSSTGRKSLMNPSSYVSKRYSTCEIKSEETNSFTQDDDDANENDNVNDDTVQVSKFVQIFMDQFGQDTDKVDTIITSDGTLNRSILENVVNHCIDEASKFSFSDKDEHIDGDIYSTSAVSESNERYLITQDTITTPVRSTTSDVFDRIRTVSAKMKQFRFGPSNVDDTMAPNVPSLDDHVGVDARTINNNIVGTVSNKVSELFKSLHIKNTTDEAAYFAFRESQDQKRRSSIDPPTTSATTIHDGDVSSQSSFRVLPRGIRNVVKGLRSMRQMRPRTQSDSEHKLEMENRQNDEDDDETMFDDVESGTGGNGDNENDVIVQQQSALLLGLSSGTSGSMDTDDNSTISGIGAKPIDRVGLASIMLSPTLLTKRHQQAIRAVESYNWAQVKYLLNANPWLAEMADINTNQYVLHKVAYYGSGQIDLDHTSEEDITVHNAPAPDNINRDLINLFPSSVHKLDRDGNLPLHMAALSANLVSQRKFDRI